MHTCTLQQSRISPTEQIYYTLGNPFAVNVISDKNILSYRAQQKHYRAGSHGVMIPSSSP